MALQNPGITSAAALTNASSGPATPARTAQAPGPFGKVWAQVASPSPRVEVQKGDTLIGLVKAQHRQQGLSVSDPQAYRLAHRIAADNRISNPDLIRPGQKIDFSRLNLPSTSPANASWSFERKQTA